MVLDFEGRALFKNSSVEQDTGRLPERWGQDGSTVKNFNFSDAGSDSTVYTVPTGKRLYINFVAIQITTADTSSRYLRDGNGGTITMSFYGTPVGQLISFTLPTPMFFDTSLYFDVPGSAGRMSCYATGWLEDAP